MYGRGRKQAEVPTPSPLCLGRRRVVRRSVCCRYEATETSFDPASGFPTYEGAHQNKPRCGHDPTNLVVYTSVEEEAGAGTG